MRQECNKLIRDKIPDIIHRAGNQCEVAILSDAEYLAALKQKLVEEAEEAATAPAEKLVAELADLCEVMEALLAASGITREQVLAAQVQKRRDRGGFERRLKLLWTQEK